MIRWVVLVLLIWAGPAAAVTCQDVTWQDLSFTACSVAKDEDLRLFQNGPDGLPLGSFAAIEAATNRPLLFAMNAGMYHPDRRPVGWFVDEGTQIAALVNRPGPGNFGLLPNGVFCIAANGATQVLTTQSQVSDPQDCRFATQSGPMLVIDGKLHPRFIRDSTSRYVRNGVGVTADGTTWFAISNEPINFHDFARFFRDRLQTPNALYFDGKVSRLYAPDLGRNDIGFALGPMVSVLGN